MTAHDPFAPGSGATPPDADEGTPKPYEAPEGGTYEAPDEKPAATEPDADDDAPETEDDASTDDDANEEYLDVPQGTTKEVLEWVGDDKDRARAALAAEQASDEPRKGLSKDLEELIGE